MRKIKDIDVINRGTSSEFQEALKAYVDGMQALGLEVEIKDPRLVINPDCVGNFNYIATVIGYETSKQQPETECPLGL